MLVKEKNKRNILEFVNVGELIPPDYVLRKIDTAIDFSKIYDLVEDLYCQDNWRRSIDSVVLFKIVFKQHIFLSPVSYNFKHRFKDETVENVFRWIMLEAADVGFIDCNAVFVDGTHIKANANMKKSSKKAVPVAAKRYAKELSDEINKDRESHGKSSKIFSFYS